MIGSHGFLIQILSCKSRQTNDRNLIGMFDLPWIKLTELGQVLRALSPQHSFGPSLREVAACANKMASDSLWVEAISDLIPCCSWLCIHDGELCEEKTILECKNSFSTRNWIHSTGKSRNDGELG